MTFWIGFLRSVLIIWAGIHSLSHMKDWFALSVSKRVGQNNPWCNLTEVGAISEKGTVENYPNRNTYFAQGTLLENVL